MYLLLLKDTFLLKNEVFPLLYIEMWKMEKNRHLLPYPENYFICREI
jgi:hypothetical protein